MGINLLRYEDIEEDMQIIKDTLNEISETLLDIKKKLK